MLLSLSDMCYQIDKHEYDKYDRRESEHDLKTAYFQVGLLLWFRHYHLLTSDIVIAL